MLIEFSFCLPGARRGALYPMHKEHALQRGGLLDVDDFSKAWRSVGLKLSLAEIRAIFAKFGEDKEGRWA